MVTDPLTAADAAALARRIEAWGYGNFWIPEAYGRNVMAHAALLLANTETLIIATGIASIYARDAMAMSAGQKGLAEQSRGRFLLGMGVSHAPLVEGRGHDYARPVKAMREYLAAMAGAGYTAPLPVEPPLTLLAALGPKMLELARDAADGAHPYNVTPEFTAHARETLGPDKLLCVEQKAILCTDAATARAAGRQALHPYLSLSNYLDNWRRLGFDETDFAGTGSDRLIDAMFAWGDETAIRARIQAHWDAGADQVCIQSIEPYTGAMIDEHLLALLAPAAQ